MVTLTGVICGQGQPEIGEMEGAPDRLRNVLIEPEDQGLWPN